MSIISRIFQTRILRRSYLDFARSECVLEDGIRLLTPLLSRIGQTFTLTQLKPILVLATDWGFRRLRVYAITHIPHHAMPPLDKIVLARRTQVHEWLLEPLVSLATRLEPLNPTEMETLGWETSTALTSAREKVLHRRLSLLRPNEPASWMGGAFWHKNCWDSLGRAVVEATRDPKYRGSLLPSAVSQALNDGGLKPLCSECKKDRLKRTEEWLDMESEKPIVEKVLKQALGEKTGWARRR